MSAAVELLDERGLDGFSVDEVARRSGVSKATIYKHWTSRLDLAVSAYGAHVTQTVPVMRTGDVVTDLLDQVQRLATAYSGSQGRIVTQLLAAGIGKNSQLLREKFFGTRRPDTVDLVHEGQSQGVLRDVLEPELVVDLLFGPIVFRMINGEPPLTADQAVQIARVAIAGLRP